MFAFLGRGSAADAFRGLIRRYGGPYLLIGSVWFMVLMVGGRMDNAEASTSVRAHSWCESVRGTACHCVPR